MTATEKGRFCKSCKKEVVNLVGLDEKELNKILSQQPNNFCARIEAKHLDSISNDSKRYWFNRIAASILIALGLVGLLTKQSNAQVIDVSKMSDDSSNKLGIKDSGVIQSKGRYRIEGILRDKRTGEVIPFANVAFSFGDITEGVEADYEGRFMFDITDTTTTGTLFDIKIAAYGYNMVEIKNLRLNNSNLCVSLNLQTDGTNNANKIKENEYIVDGMVISTFTGNKPNYIPTLNSNKAEPIPASLDTTAAVKQNKVTVPLGPSH